jgi:hypothetical protein
VIATVRFIGLINAAIWLGSAVFAILGADRVLTSGAMQELLGPKHFPYFSGAIAELVASRFWHLHIACSAVALLHLAAESLYFGRVLRKPWLILLLVLLVLGTVQSMWLQPKMHRLHVAAHAVNRPEVVRQSAAHSLRVWRLASGTMELFLIIGLATYLWRIANPPDPTRFLTPGKYRG